MKERNERFEFHKMTYGKGKKDLDPNPRSISAASNANNTFAFGFFD